MLRRLATRTASVMVGTAVGQGAVLASSLWLARVYSPAAFGSLALLLTVTNIATAVGCLRFDLVLPSSSKEDALGLLITSVVSSCALGLAAGLIEAALPRPWVVGMGAAALPPLMIGFAVTLAGLNQIFLAWLVREARFNSVGLLRAAQGVIFPVLAIFSGVGMLWAQVGSYLPGLCAIVVIAIGARRGGGRDWPQAARRNFRTPLISLPGTILDVVGYSLLLWVVLGIYGQSAGGHYSQVQRIIGAPLMLVSISVAQVLLRQTADFADDQPAMDQLIVRSFAVLASLAGLIALTMALVGHAAFRLLLGANWNISGSLGVAVACAVGVRAVVSPLSAVLITRRRFDVVLAWQIAYFCSASLIFPFLARRFAFSQFVWLYAIHEAVLYAAYATLIWRWRRGTT